MRDSLFLLFEHVLDLDRISNVLVFGGNIREEPKWLLKAKQKQPVFYEYVLDNEEGRGCFDGGVEP